MRDNCESLPSWERGLKYKSTCNSLMHCQSLPSWERGLKSLKKEKDLLSLRSLPSWERGLKYAMPFTETGQDRRSPRGSED